MKLRGIDFGRVLDASGVRGFFGEGYAHHGFWKRFGLRFDGATFVAKTTTLAPRAGNMPLDDQLRPKELLPRCVKVKPFSGVALNAVGLSGPGAEALFRDGRWQKRTSPFFLSFMSVEKDRIGRLRELIVFADMLATHLPSFSAPVGLQLNFSCPNAGLDPADLIAEAEKSLLAMSGLGIPLMPKFNALMPPEAAAEVAKSEACAAVCVSNSIPWGTLPDRVDWQKLFGKNSPLAEFGGGGLSGKPLLPIVEDWVTRARGAGLRKPINAGGGILSADDAQRLLDAGAESVFIGSAAILRPWRVAGIIAKANA